MNTLETIRIRKSIRKFNDTPVEREKLQAIAEAAVAAPAGLGRAVYATVVTKKEALDTLSSATKEAMLNSGFEFAVKMASNPNFNPLYGAPIMVLLSADSSEDPLAAGNNTSNCAAAAENAVLAATELELGSCYVTSPTNGFSVPGVKEICGIPENRTVSAIVLIGYTDDKEPAKKHINDAHIQFID